MAFAKLTVDYSVITASVIRLLRGKSGRPLKALSDESGVQVGVQEVGQKQFHSSGQLRPPSRFVFCPLLVLSRLG